MVTLVIMVMGFSPPNTIIDARKTLDIGQGVTNVTNITKLLFFDCILAANTRNLRWLRVVGVEELVEARDACKRAYARLSFVAGFNPEVKKARGELVAPCRVLAELVKEVEEERG